MQVDLDPLPAPAGPIAGQRPPSPTWRRRPGQWVAAAHRLAGGRALSPARILVLTGFVLHLVWRWWLIRGSSVPAAHADEDGYLLIARAMAGGAGGYTIENGPFFRVGYPLLLSPIYLGGGDAFAIYHRALELDAVFGALVVPLAALFARRVLALPARWSAAAGVAVAALPAVAYYLNTVLTDTVLPALALGWLLLLHAWLAARPGRARLAYAVAAGAMAGLTYTIHVRGTMVLIVHALATVGVLLARRVRLVPALASLVAAAVLAGVDPLCRRLLADSVVLLGNNPRSQITSTVLADWRIALVLLRALGQVWYLGVGTGGFGLVGLLVVLYPLVSRARLRRELARPGGLARLVTLLAVLGTTVLVISGSATSLPFGENRITYFAYPRYLHFLFGVWFLIGLAALRAASRRSRLWFAGGAGVLLVTAGLIMQWRTAQETGSMYIPFDAPELVALSGQANRFVVLGPTFIVAGWLAGCAVALYHRYSAALVLPALIGLCLIAVPYTQRAIIRPMTAPQYLPNTPRLVRDLRLGPGDVVAEAYQVPFPTAFNHAREVNWQRLILFDANQPPPQPANVVIGPWNPYTGQSWDGRRYGMHPIGSDPYHGWVVWRRSPEGSGN